MSSYISSEYYLERQRRLAIVNQCEQELQQAVRAASRNREEWKAMLEKRAQGQAALEQREQQAADETTAQSLRAETQRKILSQQITQLLANAQSQIRNCGSASVSGSLDEQLKTMQTGFSMFGATQELQRQLEHFVNEEIPRQRELVREQDEQHRMEEALQQNAALAGANVRDASRQFVSMQTTAQTKEAEYTSPWDNFVRRLEKLSLQQQVFGETQAQTWLEEAKQVAPAQRNLFLLQHQAEIQAMEEACMELTDAFQAHSEQLRQLQDRYLALCMLCEIQPTLPEEASEADLEKEVSALFEQYSKARERQYITNAFSEVLEDFGIDFEAMQTDEHGQLQMRYHISHQAGLQITRSDAGAFEMQFTGTAEGETPSLDEKRQVVEQAHSFCKRLPEIAAALGARGILFDQVAVQEPSEETVAMISRQGRARVYQTQKAREMPQ